MKKILLATLTVILSFTNYLFSSDKLQDMLTNITTLGDAEFIGDIRKFYPEVELLTQETEATPEGVATDPSKCLSFKLFTGKYHPEFDRTMGGLLAIKWLLSGDYEAFKSKVPAPIFKLSEDNFKKLRTYVEGILQGDTELLDVVIAFVALNDIGKVKEPFTAVQANKPEILDHDIALLEIFENPGDYNVKFTKTFNRLLPANQKVILDGLRSELNIPQFVQAENAPANLAKYRNVDPQTRNLYELHFLFDVAGAASHTINCDGGTIIGDSLLDAYFKGFKALKQIDKKSPLDVYDSYLMDRAASLGTDIKTPKNRALVRLAILNRADIPKAYADTVAAFDKLSSNEQETLISELNKHGINDSAILLYYAPALIANAKRTNPADGVFIALQAMARLYQQARGMKNFPTKPGVFAININEMAVSAKDKTVLSEFEKRKFAINPFGEGAKAKVTEGAYLKYPKFTSKDVFETLPLDSLGKEFQKIIVSEINKDPATELAIVTDPDFAEFAEKAKELLPANHRGERIALQTLARIYKAVRQFRELPENGVFKVDIDNFVKQVIRDGTEDIPAERIAGQALAQFNKKNIVVELDKENKNKAIAKITTMMPRYQWSK